MRSVKLSAVLVVLAVSLGMAFLSGCSQNGDLANRNRIQAKPYHGAGEPVAGGPVAVDPAQEPARCGQLQGGVEVETLRQKIAALEEDIAKKEALIKSMQDRLMGVSVLRWS